MKYSKYLDMHRYKKHKIKSNMHCQNKEKSLNGSNSPIV